MARGAGAQQRTTINLALDSAIFGAFLAATAPRLTGIAIHEWLGIAFGVAIMTHLLLHWQWIIEVARRFFGKVTWTARVNYVLNTLLFIVMTIIIATGLMISEAALPLLGFQLPHDHIWSQIHRLASDAAVLLIGFHVALHWRWIVNSTRRLLRISTRRPASITQPVTVTSRAVREVP